MQAIFEIINTQRPMGYIFHDTKEHGGLIMTMSTKTLHFLILYNLITSESWQGRNPYTRAMNSLPNLYVKAEPLPPIFDALEYH